MKKLFGLFGIIIISSLCFITNLSASTGNIYVSSSKNSCVVGDTFYVYVKISSAAALGSWEYTISYDANKVKYVSGETTVVGYGDGNIKSKTYTYTFKAISSGTSNVSVKSYRAYDWSESLMSLNVGSTKIQTVTQAELEASYSKNNNLSSIIVDGYNLIPEFNKDILEYSVSVPSDKMAVVISASVEDKTARLNGVGEVNVSEGENKFELVVTAQNGSTKTYVVKVNVVDENPIKAIVNGKEYTVVKRASSLTMPDTYAETTLVIDGFNIPAFESQITKYTLVGLKDNNGKIGLFIYDEEKDNYYSYNQLKTNGVTLFIKEAKEVPNLYDRKTILIGDNEIPGFNYKYNKDFYLLYGVNIETGEEGYYQYDKKEGTLSRYNEEVIKDLLKRNDNYIKIILVLALETIVLVMLLIISLNKQKKNKRMIKDISDKIDNKRLIKEEKNELNDKILEKKSKKNNNKKEKSLNSKLEEL